MTKFTASLSICISIKMNGEIKGDGRNAQSEIEN